MKIGNSQSYNSLFLIFQHYRLDKLFIALLLSVALISCSDGGSSNSNGDDGPPPPSVECTDDFGDASRCETREDL